MNSVFGLPLLTLFVIIVKVCGQACPEGNNVAKMCVPGTYSGERVLIDTASYDPSVSNCSCTFGTNSSVMKLVTYVAPNFPECNSAIRLYSSSGNSIRFQCLMSGTYLDTSQYNAGVATFETYADYYDKKYCLVLEVAGRVDDTVTVSCTADVPEVSATAASSVKQDTMNVTSSAKQDTMNVTSSVQQDTMNVTSSVKNDTMNVTSGIVTESNPANIDVVMNQSTVANDVSSSSVDLTATIDQTTKQAAEEISTKTATITSTDSAIVAEKISTVATYSVTETTTNTAVKSTEARPEATTSDAVAVNDMPEESAVGTGTVRDAASTGAVEVDIMIRNSSGAEKNVNETTTPGVIVNESSKSEILKFGTKTTETFPKSTTAGVVVTTEAVSATSKISTSSESSIIPNTIHDLNVNHIQSENASNTPHELDIMFTSNMVNDIDNTNDTAHNASVDHVELFDDNSTSNLTEFKPKEDLNTLVTGTILFNRGGTGLSKTIQNIDSVQANIFSDKAMTPEPLATQIPEVTNNIQGFNSENPYKVSEDTQSSNSDIIFTTVPIDLSNSLVMDTRSSFIESDTNNSISDASIANNSNTYSMQFSAFDSVEVPSNQSTENTTADPLQSYFYNTHNENNTLVLDTNYDRNGLVNDTTNISASEAYIDNNPAINIDTPISFSNNLSDKIDSSIFQNNAEVNTVQSIEVTNKAFQTSPYIINEARLIMESSEPIDIANMPIKTHELVENTTHPMTNDFTNQKSNQTIIESANSVNFGSNVTESDLFPTTFSGFQVDLTDSAVNNRSEEIFPVMYNQTTGSEASAPILFSSNITTGLENEINNLTDGFNETYDRNIDLVADPMTELILTSESVPTTPRSLDAIYEEQLYQNANINDTDMAAKGNNITSIQEKSNYTELVNEFSNVGFDKRNSFDIVTYATPIENIVENSSNGSDIVNQNYDNAHNTNFNEVLNETMPIVGDSVERMHASLVHNSVPVYEINATETSMASTSFVDTPSHGKINLLEERAVYPGTTNQTVDETAVLPGGNKTTRPYYNETGSIFVQEEEAVYAETTTPVDTSSTPVQSEEREVSHLSFINRMSEPYSANLTDATQDIANENINNFTNSYIEDEQITDNTLNQTEADVVDQSASIYDGSPLSYDVQSNETVPVLSEKDINQTEFFHNLGGIASEVTFTENSSTHELNVTTENVDNLTSSTNRFDEPFIKTEHTPEINLTQTLPNAVDQGLYLVEQTTNSYSFDVKTSEAAPLNNGKSVDHLNLVHRLNESASEIDILDNSTTTQIPAIVTENVDNLSLVHGFDEPLIKTDHLPETNLTKTLHNSADQGLDMAGETTNSHLINVQTSEATPTHSGMELDHFNFVNRLSDSAFETNITENSQIHLSDAAIENVDNMTFIHRMGGTLNHETLPESNYTQSLTNTVDHGLFMTEKTTSAYQPETQSSEATLTDMEVSHSLFEHRPSEPLANDIATGSALDVMAETMNDAKFINRFSDNVFNDAKSETSTIKMETSSVSSKLLSSELSGQTTAAANTVNEYMLDNSIDQHNFLSSIDAVPFDLAKENVKSTTHETPKSSTMFIPTTTFTFEKEVRTEKTNTVDENTTFKHSFTSYTTTPSDLTKLTTDPATSSFDGMTKSTTEAAPIIVEDMIVRENVLNELNAVPQNIADIQTSDSVVPSDVLADIEKQIIPKIKQSSPSILEPGSSSKDTANEKLSTTSMPESVVNDTQIENVTVNEADPEPIIPKRVPDKDVTAPTTPKQSFGMVEDAVAVEDQSQTVTDTPGGSGMNVYFDTGKSKSSAFDMNNDTYIIVVGAIVGLVVLAVVIGIFCHNGRKRRSEKVNISGNNSEAPSHQNQAFDNGAVSDVPAATVTQNGGGSPEVNGSAGATDVNNGNVEL